MILIELTELDKLRIQIASGAIGSIMDALGRTGVPKGKNQADFVAQLSLEFADAILKRINIEKDIQKADEKVAYHKDEFAIAAKLKDIK